MKYFLYPSLVLLSFQNFAQTNESPTSEYVVKGSKTELQEGYVVLKSGKKLFGEISLKGSLSAPTEIRYVGDGKDIDFPPGALQAFGLVGVSADETQAASGPICDNPENIFEWRDMGIIMGKQINNTKPRNGYVILRDGKKVEGDLQLIKVDGVFDELKIKTEDKQKYKLAPNEVSHYGLSMTISELTDNGSKTYKDEARNFHEGSVTMKDGSIKKGFLAFQDKTLINSSKPNLGHKFMGVYYAASKTANITTFQNANVKELSQNINGETVKYYKYAGGFVASTEMDDVKYKDETRMFNKGTIVLTNGETLSGEVALDKSGTFYAQGLRFKTSTGALKSYDAADIKSGHQIIDGEEEGFFNLDGKLVREVFNGNTFQLYRNPEPTTIDVGKTNTARTLSNLGTTQLASFVISEDERKNGYETNLDSVIQVSSAEELMKIQEAFYRLQGYNSSNELQEKSSNETAKKYDAALGLAIVGKQTEDSIKVYNEEWFLVNKKTNEKTVLYKDGYKDKMEPILLGCYTFLSLDKSEQKDYYKMDNMKSTAKMLDECY